MNTLVVHFELRVLRLQSRSSGVLVNEVLMLHFVVVRERRIHSKTALPGECEALLRALEVILDMALAAHVGAHLLG